MDTWNHHMVTLKILLLRKKLWRGDKVVGRALAVCEAWQTAFRSPGPVKAGSSGTPVWSPCAAMSEGQLGWCTHPCIRQTLSSPRQSSTSTCALCTHPNTVKTTIMKKVGIKGEVCRMSAWKLKLTLLSTPRYRNKSNACIWKQTVLEFITTS